MKKEVLGSIETNIRNGKERIRGRREREVFSGLIVWQERNMVLWRETMFMDLVVVCGLSR